MFLVDMQFQDMAKITPELTAQHRSYLQQQYQSGQLLFGGRKVPRTGGILISRHASAAELQQVLGSVDVCLRDAFLPEPRLARRMAKPRLAAFASRATRSSVGSGRNPKGIDLKARRALLQSAYSDQTVARTAPSPPRF